MKETTLVKNSPQEKLLDKIAELNKSALAEERKEWLEAHEKLIKELLPKYNSLLATLARKWLGVRPKAFWKLNDDEKMLLDEPVFRRAKKHIMCLHAVTILLCCAFVRALFLVPAAIELAKKNPNGPGIIFVVLLGLGWAIPLISYLMSKNSWAGQFIKARKLCFPEDTEK